MNGLLLLAVRTSLIKEARSSGAVQTSILIFLRHRKVNQTDELESHNADLAEAVTVVCALQLAFLFY